MDFKPQPPISKVELLRLFSFDETTSEFFWKVKPSKNRVAGSKAGYTRKEDGYRIICINKIDHYVHKLVWLYHTGIYPDYIDHVDNNTSNNVISNLRLSTHTQNMHNQKLSKANTTGIKGICYDKNRNRYIASVQCEGISKTKSYSILKYGTTEALQLATEFVVTLRNDVHKEFANHG